MKKLFWKVRVKTYIKTIDEKVWLAILTGWSPPTIAIEDKTICIYFWVLETEVKGSH